MSKTVLVTGGAGFVGSSLSLSLKEKYPDYRVISFDNLRRRGSELNLHRLRQGNVEFVHGDIRNSEDLGSLPKIDAIVECSAEPSVLAGLEGTPDYVVNTNLLGTVNCLNHAVRNQADFVFLSTSRVYPIQNIEKIGFEELETRFTISENQHLKGVSEKGLCEDFPLEGFRSIYGATKLCSELLIAEYNEFYKLKTVINRCGVLTGPWQMGKVDQGVIVLWMARHFWKQSLSYFGYGGKGKQVRDILHVSDLFRLIDWQLHNLDQVNGETLNVGGGPEISVSLLELTELCHKITGNKVAVSSVPENRQADIRIYLTDNSKVTNLTGWKPEIGAEEILTDIYQWIQNNSQELEQILK